MKSALSIPIQIIIIIILYTGVYINITMLSIKSRLWGTLS